MRRVLAALLVPLVLPSLTAWAGSGEKKNVHMARELLENNAQWNRAMTRGNEDIQNRDYIDAETEFLSALKVANGLEKSDPRGLAKTCWSLGTVESALGKKEKAEALFSRAVTLEEKDPDLDESMVADHFRALGNLYMTESKFAKAKKVYERAVDHATNANAEVGHDPDWRAFAADQYAFANATLQSGDPAAAEPLFENARISYAKVPGGIVSDEDHRFIGKTMMGKVQCLVAAKKTTEAGTLFEELVSHRVEGSCEAYAKFLKGQKRDADAKSLPCMKQQ